MSDTNIKYNKGIVDRKSGEIETKIEQLLVKKIEEYDRILSAFAISECDEAAAIRNEIEMEKTAVAVMAEFYKKLVNMIHNASQDVEQMENNYTADHVTIGSSGKGGTTWMDFGPN